ncbi:hypothetical protein D3C87_1154670 [compost metagenome]
MLDVTLHPPVARFESTEFNARQPQARYRLHIVYQHLWRSLWATVFQYGLEFFQQLGVFGGGGVVECFLHLQQYRRAMFAVAVDGAGACGIDHQQSAFG